MADDEAALPTEVEVYVQLGALIAQEVGTPQVMLAHDTELDDIPGWDSVSMVGVLIEIERQFGIQLDRRSRDGLRVAADLVAMVREASKRR